MITKPDRQRGRPNVVKHSDHSVTVFNYKRATTLNLERARHWAVRAKQTETDRTEWGWLWKAARLEPFERVSFTVTAGYKSRPQDHGNCLPTAKAAIDAFVDVGLLPDDSPKYVASLTFMVDTEAAVDYVSITVRRK